MFDDIPTRPSAIAGVIPTERVPAHGTCDENAFAAFVAERPAALQHAGHLLAGAAGLRLADAVIADVAAGGVPTRTARQRRQRLLDLLNLRNVHVEGSVEAARFATVDPADPCVEEICLLADAYADALLPSEGAEDEDVDGARNDREAA